MVTKARVRQGNPIDSACCYDIRDFMFRTGLNRNSMRQARKAGLIVRKVGSRNFVLGKDWIEFVESKAAIVS